MASSRFSTMCLLHARAVQPYRLLTGINRPDAGYSKIHKFNVAPTVVVTPRRFASGRLSARVRQRVEKAQAVAYDPNEIEYVPDLDRPLSVQERWNDLRSSVPYDSVLQAACRCGFVPLEFEEAQLLLLTTWELLDLKESVHDMVQLCAIHRTTVDTLSRLTRLMVITSATPMQRRFASKILHAAITVNDRLATIDAAMFGLYDSGSGAGDILAKFTRVTDTPVVRNLKALSARHDPYAVLHLIVRLRMEGTLKADNIDWYSAEINKLYDNFDEIAMSALPRAQTDHFDPANPHSPNCPYPHPYVSQSPPLSRMLRDQGIAQFQESPLDPTICQTFELAAKNYDDPAAYSFLAWNYDDDLSIQQMNNAKKAAFSADKSAAYLVGKLYSMPDDDETSIELQGDPEVRAEWQSRKYTSKIWDRFIRWYYNPDAAVGIWWRVDGGPAQIRNSLALHWLGIARWRGHNKASREIKAVEFDATAASKIMAETSNTWWRRLFTIARPGYDSTQARSQAIQDLVHQAYQPRAGDEGSNNAHPLAVRVRRIASAKFDEWELFAFALRFSGPIGTISLVGFYAGMIWVGSWILAEVLAYLWALGC